MIVAVFFFHHRHIMEMMGGFFQDTVSPMVVMGGYSLPR
jgi:hypothetical protein